MRCGLESSQNVCYFHIRMNALIELWAAIVAACAANPWRTFSIGLLVGGVVWWCVDRIRKKFARRCAKPECRCIMYQQRIAQMIPMSVDEIPTAGSTGLYFRLERVVMLRVVRLCRSIGFVPRLMPQTEADYWFKTLVLRQCLRCWEPSIQVACKPKRFTIFSLVWRLMVHPSEFVIRRDLFVQLRLDQNLPQALRPVRGFSSGAGGTMHAALTPPETEPRISARLSRCRRYPTD